MMNPLNSIVINASDNVATALVELLQGDVGRYALRGKTMEVPVVENIPRYHKFAICSMDRNERVRKYGEVIGRAAGPIALGAHVHDHNMLSPGRDQS